MKLPLFGSLLAFASILALQGCGSKAPEGGATTGPEGDAKPSGNLEVALFKGGYGIDFFEQTAKEYEEAHPGVKIKVEGNPRIWEQLRPRFVAGNPPDLTFPGWGLDHWSLIYEGQLMPLDAALDSKPYEGEGSWRDTFEPSLLKLGRHEGKQYFLPHFFNVLGWWYDPQVFEKNGWAVPKTYEELLALCPKIKAKGLSPITYQGKYPYYMIAGFLLPWTVSAGGIEAVDAIQNLEPGAWKSPAVLQAARMIVELKTKGFFQDGAIGMSHTESQSEFVNGRAAMIPCGTWLKSEMAKVMPATAKMQFMLPPVLAAGKGDPTAVIIGIEPWMVPTKGKNPELAVDFYKYVTSLTKAKQFVEQKGALTAVKGSDQANLPEDLKAPAAAFKASKTAYSIEFRQWYPTLETEVENAMTALLNGEATPEQFCERCEAGAEKVRKDASIPKHKIQRGDSS